MTKDEKKELIKEIKELSKKIHEIEIEIKNLEKTKLKLKDLNDLSESNKKELDNTIKNKTEYFMSLISLFLKKNAEKEYQIEKEENEKLKLEYRPPEHDVIPRPKKIKSIIAPK